MALMEVVEQNFVEEVIKSEVPVVVDFWSPSCSPCRQLVPILESLAEENDGVCKFVKVNVYEAPRVGSQYGVDMLPTLLFFNRGRVVERMIGVQSHGKLQDILDDIE